MGMEESVNKWRMTIDEDDEDDEDNEEERNDEWRMAIEEMGNEYPELAEEVLQYENKPSG